MHVDVTFYVNVILGAQSLRAASSSQRSASVDAACCCLSQSSRAVSRNVDEQIAAALLRLQRDMATVLHRLDALEALALSQVKKQKQQLHFIVQDPDLFNLFLF